MTYTKTPKTTAVYKYENKFNEASTLSEDGSYMLAEDSTLIVFVSYLMNIFNKVAKTLSSWTKVTKP